MTKKKLILGLLTLNSAEGGLNFLFREAALRKVVGPYRNFYCRIRSCTYAQLNEVYNLTLHFESLYRNGQLHCGFGV